MMSLNSERVSFQGCGAPAPQDTTEYLPVREEMNPFKPLSLGKLEDLSFTLLDFVAKSESKVNISTVEKHTGFI